MNALLMIKIGFRLLLTVVVVARLRHVGGQLLNNDGDDGQISSAPHSSNILVSDNIACPPCRPSECVATAGFNGAITVFNASESNQIFDQNNATSLFDSDGKQCLNDGIPQLDDCSCCAICVRRPNETCGGIARRLGVCQPGSTCWPVSPAKGVLLNGSEVGVCIGK